MATTTLLLILVLHVIGTLSSVVPSDESQLSTCNPCCQGLAGLSGVPGSAGIPGSNGLPGRDGFRGDVGAKGGVGETGNPGEWGPLGPQGPSGERGKQGLQGLPGKVGPIGMKGRAGADGQHGADGQSGLVGPKGQQGDSPEVRQSAFTVIKNSPQTGSTGGVLTFDIAQTNIGSHYSMQSNKFTCQVAGTYVFMFTISSNYHDQNPNIILTKDGAVIIRAHVRDSQSSVHNFHQSSNAAILQLDIGNQVWLKFSVGNNAVFSNSNKYTAFSGFLLYAV